MNQREDEVTNGVVSHLPRFSARTDRHSFRWGPGLLPPHHRTFDVNVTSPDVTPFTMDERFSWDGDARVSGQGFTGYAHVRVK